MPRLLRPLLLFFVLSAAAAGQDQVPSAKPFTVSALALSSDGTVLATGGYTGEITLFDVATAKEIGKFGGHQGLVNALTFSSDGNLLAIVWGLAKPEQMASILKVMDEARMAEPVPTRVVYPSYPIKLIAVENVLGGLENYHTDASWLWLGAFHLIALTQNGDQERACPSYRRAADCSCHRR